MKSNAEVEVRVVKWGVMSTDANILVSNGGVGGLRNLVLQNSTCVVRDDFLLADILDSVGYGVLVSVPWYRDPPCGVNVLLFSSKRLKGREGCSLMVCWLKGCRAC